MSRIYGKIPVFITSNTTCHGQANFLVFQVANVVAVLNARHSLLDFVIFIGIVFFQNDGIGRTIRKFN
eukprot:14490.XXX_551851_552054_1 [CDS] Oithona nana genome sequencing.